MARARALIRTIGATAAAGGLALTLGIATASPAAAADTPLVSVNDVQVTETDSTPIPPPSSAVFTLTRTGDLSASSTVHFQTGAGVGGATASADFVQKSGTVTFAPGQTTATVQVLVLGDDVHEGAEAFSIRLTGVTNAAVVEPSEDDPTTLWPEGDYPLTPEAGNRLGWATIVDDEPAPTLSVSDASVVEGGPTGTMLRFTVTQSVASNSMQWAHYATTTVRNTPFVLWPRATAGSDYVASDSFVHVQAGQRQAFIDIPVIGDHVRESDEHLGLVITNGSLTIADDYARGTIVNDDYAFLG